MSSDNARYCIKMFIYKEVYQYFLLIEEKERNKGDGIYFSERTKIDLVTKVGLVKRASVLWTYQNASKHIIVHINIYMV